MGATGITTIDFGAAPGDVEASVPVTGQAAIVSGSLVEAWVRLVATADHSIDEARFEQVKFTAGTIVPATGFTIYGESLKGLVFGEFDVQWVWNGA